MLFDTHLRRTPLVRSNTGYANCSVYNECSMLTNNHIDTKRFFWMTLFLGKEAEGKVGMHMCIKRMNINKKRI